jgi:NAD(P)-dependent dehydrogenase (short-subunit alcohol dehydrogenase family)
MSDSDKLILVTGAKSGIGAAAVRTSGWSAYGGLR